MIHQGNGHANGNGTNGAVHAAVLPRPVLLAIAERLASLTDASAGPTGCHIWLGPQHPSGWPRITIRKSWSVRQLVWLVAHGTLPPRVFRLCSQPRCVARHHLTTAKPHRRRPLLPAASRPSRRWRQHAHALLRTLARQYQHDPAMAVAVLRAGKRWRSVMRT